MIGEAHIEINGTKLSEGQAMALRVACTSFFQEMSEGDSPLGPEELAQRMAALLPRSLERSPAADHRRPMTKGCPHKDIQFCPLYLAMHSSRLFGFSCDDGQLGSGLCAVARKLDYAKTVARLEAAWPGLVAERRFQEEAEEAKEQRRRNMRLLGLH
ncbi:hypothetical protein ATY76_14205 [Rhizobium sp. R339]|uniref:hypothetical protein n=1 Tax=Rhizobium sp. R339 TaxID=1764273 RepID=UPI000B53153E|nr:hypothetical protein [Rhizobium sp. R339]OWV68060.1 hypothetical protein ATY76_14205 [Rhizobium sp. R339]